MTIPDPSKSIDVVGVSHAYGDLQVLSDISFSVMPGEILAIVGPSGCGKSTLLSIIGGLLEPTRGQVSIDPGDAGSWNPLTFVFQDFALLPWRTVEDNVALALEHRPIGGVERDETVRDALRRTNLTDFAKALPKQLSGGMRQRVGLARALAVKPSILLMDEPLSALDSQTREILMEDLSQLLVGSQLSVAYVTHNLDEAVRLADRVAVFSRRPGVIRRIVDIPVDRARRTEPAAQAELASVQSDLWALIREEATQADREMIDA